MRRRGRPRKHPTITLTEAQYQRFIELYPVVTDIQELLDEFPEYTQKELTLYANRLRLRLTEAARCSCHFRESWKADDLPRGPTGIAWHKAMLKVYCRRCQECKRIFLRAGMIQCGRFWYCEKCVLKKWKAA